MNKEPDLETAVEEEITIQDENSYRQAALPGIDVATSEEPDGELRTQVQLKRVIEALLFASGEPLPFNKIREITDTFHPLSTRELRNILQSIQEEYLLQQRAFRLEEIAQGYVLRTCEEYSPYIELLGRSKRNEKITQASAEVLAIIAYRQPITRAQIEGIRGVDCSGHISNLLERQLVQPVGKLEAPGRPTLYGITKDFLRHFGLRDIKELPQL